MEVSNTIQVKIIYLFFLFLASQAQTPTLDSIKSTDLAPQKIVATGKRESLEPIINGQLHGKARYYHPNGQLYGVIEYKNGLKTGTHQLFREDGSLEQELSYKDGQPHGTCKWFDEKGQLQTTVIYKQGQPIERTDVGSTQKSKQPSLAKPTDPLLIKIDSAFEKIKTTEDLIKLAINTASEDLVDKNIKSRAYQNLSELLTQDKDTELIKLKYSLFKSDFEKQKSEWIKSNIGYILIQINPKTDFQHYLATLEVTAPTPNKNFNINLISKYQNVLEQMTQFSPTQDEFNQMTHIVYQKMHLWPDLTKSAFKTFEIWILKNQNLNIDSLVGLYFKLDNLIKDHRQLLRNPQGRILIATYSTWEFVTQNQVFLKNLICTKKPDELKTQKLSRFAYIQIDKGQSENKFNDQIEILKCQ